MRGSGDEKVPLLRDTTLIEQGNFSVTSAITERRSEHVALTPRYHVVVTKRSATCN